jgi:hypothetical protein
LQFAILGPTFVAFEVLVGHGCAGRLVLER